MTSTHRSSTAHDARQAEDEGDTIWNCAEDLLAWERAVDVKGSGHCRARVVREYRWVVAIARVPDVSFGVRNDPEWSTQQVGERSRIRPQAAASSEAVAGPVGAMGTRL